MKRKMTLNSKPLKSSQVPVTTQMLHEMEGRLVHKFDAGLNRLRAEIKSEIAEVRSEIAEVRSEIAEVKSEIAGIKSEIAEIKVDILQIKSEVSGIKSEVHRIALLVEEQNARNKFVLDGYSQLYELIERKLG